MGILRGFLASSSYCRLLSAHKQLRTLTLRYRHSQASAVRPWTSQEIRSTFIEYFKAHDHLFVPSSSVIPKRGEGTYFINAGMNQFKPVFLGTIDANTEMAAYKRVVNSQKCIRVGGKHNDLEDVGKDTYHHTFFEMLGNWSFGDYFKHEACKMAWSLMTEVYQIPAQSLYVTYFGGSEELGLEPDLDCRDIWLEIGVPKDHVLPFGMADNFWEMGETGPCGSCTEIHYAHGGQSDVGHLVNSGSPEVVELWNLVFMQYDRQSDGSLKILPHQHVDTGMGLERLTAVLQGHTSNYDTDLFQPIFTAISEHCQTPYQGRVGAADAGGMDTAYRTVADHLRMATVAIADGLRPGKLETERKLRLVIDRCMKQAHTVLEISPTLISGLVPVVVDILGDHFPEVQKNSKEVHDVISFCAERYLDQRQIGEHMLQKALNKYGDVNSLTGDHMWELWSGRFGHPVTIETLQDIAPDFNLSLDVDAFDKKFNSMKAHQVLPKLKEENGVQLGQLDRNQLEYIRQKKLPMTDDSHKYRDTAALHMSANVLLLRVNDDFVEEVQPGDHVALLLDQTCFYSESGGQVADRGTISTTNGCIISVRDVQSTQGYVMHTGVVEEGNLSVSDEVQLVVNQACRERCTSNHTATHLINHALERSFGNVKQQSSLVMPEYLSFGFTCKQETLSLEQIQNVEDIVNTIISHQVPVDKRTVPLSRVRQVDGVRMLTDEIYPNDVRVISVGAALDALLADDGERLAQEYSVELCGGTHVSNTGELGCLAITNLTGSQHGVKRLTAVTGDAALQAVEKGKQLKSRFKELVTAVRTQDSKRAAQLKGDIEKMLGEEVLPKVYRDSIQAGLDKLAESGLSEQKNKDVKQSYKERLEVLLECSANQKFIVEKFSFGKTRDMVDAIAMLTPQKPFILLSPTSQSSSKYIGVSYVPVSTNGLASEAWARHICSHMKNGSCSMPKGKYAKRAPTVRVMTFESHKQLDLDHAIDLARTFANLFLG